MKKRLKRIEQMVSQLHKSHFADAVGPETPHHMQCNFCGGVMTPEKIIFHSSSGVTVCETCLDGMNAILVHRRAALAAQTKAMN